MKNNPRKSKKKLAHKKKYYDIAFIALIGTMIVLTFLVIPREYRLLKNNNEVQSVIDTFNNLNIVGGTAGEDAEIAESEELPIKIGSYKVIGLIKISSIGLEYPILNRTTDDSLWLSITKLSGPNLNEYGNVSLAGHNARSGKLFGRLSMVQIDDIIEIIDHNKKTINYQVYDIYSVVPEDTTPTKTTDSNSREITLISCIMSGKKRIIVKAKEIV